MRVKTLAILITGVLLAIPVVEARMRYGSIDQAVYYMMADFNGWVSGVWRVIG